MPNYVHRGRSISLLPHHHGPSRYSNPTDGVACFDPKPIKETTFSKPKQTKHGNEKELRTGSYLVGGMGFGERLLGKRFGGRVGIGIEIGFGDRSNFGLALAEVGVEEEKGNDRTQHERKRYDG